MKHLNIWIISLDVSHGMSESTCDCKIFGGFLPFPPQTAWMWSYSFFTISSVEFWHTAYRYHLIAQSLSTSLLLDPLHPLPRPFIHRPSNPPRQGLILSLPTHDTTETDDFRPRNKPPSVHYVSASPLLWIPLWPGIKACFLTGQNTHCSFAFLDQLQHHDRVVHLYGKPHYIHISSTRSARSVTDVSVTVTIPTYLNKHACEFWYFYYFKNKSFQYAYQLVTILQSWSYHHILLVYFKHTYHVPTNNSSIKNSCLQYKSHSC